jgi:DNA-directed RNA polymerase specialized sigma24 family protein
LIQVQVRTALARLAKQVSATSFQVLYLRWIEGRTFLEIADALDLMPDQVRFRHHRMKQKFRELFERLIEQNITEANQVQLRQKKRTGSARNKSLDSTSNK